jgi:hypothetical protein
MNIKLLILSAFITLGLFSCKNNGDLAPIVLTANLNVVNASADTINFYQNGARLNNASILVPGYEYGYLSVPSGSTIYQFKKAGNVNYLIPNYPLKLDSNAFYSLFVAGETTDKLFLIKDTTSLAPSTTAATIRFVNASPSLSLDVKMGALSFSNQAFKSATSYNYITTGAITVKIYQSGTTTLLASGPVTLIAGTIYTLFTRGVPSGTGQNQFAVSLIIN